MYLARKFEDGHATDGQDSPHLWIGRVRNHIWEVSLLFYQTFSTMIPWISPHLGTLLASGANMLSTVRGSPYMKVLRSLDNNAYSIITLKRAGYLWATTSSCSTRSRPLRLGGIRCTEVCAN